MILFQSRILFKFLLRNLNFKDVLKPKVLLAFIILSFLSCGSSSKLHLPKSTSDTSSQKLAIFFDGTGNNEKSNSNVLKLRNLTTNRNDPNYKAIYIKGVGTEYRVIGLATGWGISYDVRIAYKFLTENYNPSRKDKLFFFGFSRGAYATRILTGFIRSAGLPDLCSYTESQKISYIKKIYHAYKGKFNSFEERKKAVDQKISKNITHSYPRVEFLGIWDTVEALGFPNGKEDFDYPNHRYDDNLEIVNKVAHAMSLDDRRGYLFTPILMTNARLVEGKTNEEAMQIINNKVEEVWFAGAHSDVGGTYENTFSENYSLRWMFGQLKEFNILPKNIDVVSNFQGKLHFGRDGIHKVVTRDKERDINKYLISTGYNNNKLKVHYSVFDRLKTGISPYKEGLPTIFTKCFSKKDNGYEYVGNKNCESLELVTD